MIANQMISTTLRTILILLLLIPGFYLIRLLTLLALINVFGGSAAGTEKSIQTFNLFPVQHLPIILTVGILVYLAVKRRENRDSKMLISKIVIICFGTCIYLLMIHFDLLVK
jgi:hypothetical protein